MHSAAICCVSVRSKPGLIRFLKSPPKTKAADLMDRAFDAWFQDALADPPDGVRRILRRRSRSQKPRDALRNAAANLAEHRDFPTAWRRDPFNRTSDIDALCEA